MDNKFLTFIRPYLNYIDQGYLFRKPFSWLYTIIATINLLVPLYILYEFVDKKLFSIEPKLTIMLLLFWLIVSFAGWVSFQLWWDRRTKITFSSEESAEFVATPVFAHFIQTFGEWLGTWIGLVGFGFALLATLLLGEQGLYLPIPVLGQYLGVGWVYVFLMPIYGFLIIVITRFMAEQIKALSTIANQSKPR